FCLHQEGGLLGQVSELSVPACGAFVEYSSCNPFSPKIRGLWTHITIGPKKWGQAKRIRISEQIRQNQERLNFFLAWTQAESQEVGKAYDNLIKQVRRKVGLAMKAAWEAPPITEDAEMSIPQSVVDLGGLEAYESEYFQQLESHLK